MMRGQVGTRPQTPGDAAALPWRLSASCVDRLSHLLGGRPVAYGNEPPPLPVLSLWADDAAPLGMDGPTQQQWGQLADLGALCAAESWAEVSAQPGLNDLLAEAVLRFQYTETVIAQTDSRPLPWGPTSPQALVAALMCLWTVAAHKHGIPPDDPQLARAQHATSVWLTHVCTAASPLPGDMVILHVLHEGVRSCRRPLREELAAAREEVTRLEDERDHLRQQTWRGSRRERRATCERLPSVEAALPGARERVRRLTAASEEFEQWLERWAALDLLNDVAGGSSGAARTHLCRWLAALVEQPGAEGLQWWLIRRLVRRCPRRDALSAPNQAVSDYLAAVTPPQWGTAAASPGVLRRLEFLARFYRAWVYALGPTGATAQIAPAASPPATDLLGPWRALVTWQSDPALPEAARSLWTPEAPDQVQSVRDPALYTVARRLQELAARSPATGTAMPSP